METEYQVKYPLWIEGRGEYTENHQKQKLLAYASKCHTPIFGVSTTTPTPNVTVAKKSKSLERVVPGSILRDPPKLQNKKKTTFTSRSPTRIRKTARSVSPKKTARSVSLQKSARSVSPKKRPVITRQIRCVPGVKRRTKISLTLSTSAYLKLLCNIDNVRPAPIRIS